MARIAFRFTFTYFLLFSLFTQILSALFPVPNVDVPDLSALPAARQMVLWTAAHVLGIQPPPPSAETGSGDRTVDWVLVFCLLVLAAIVSGVWSVLDRKRPDYITLQKWFRVFIRFALAGQMITYGLDKLVPLQMPFPYLTKLIEPYGNFSPMGVLWSSIGSSPAYEMFSGSVELLGGLLLIVEVTAMAGGLICLAAMIQVFLLNMTYDVPVKLLSFHLILLSLAVLAPDLARLAGVLLGRGAAPSAHPPLFRAPRANRIALTAQVAFGILLVGLNAYGSRAAWYTYGGGSPKSALYGIWSVTQPGGAVSANSRRVIFDSPTSATFQRMDDQFDRYVASIDSKRAALTLTRYGDPKWKAGFTFARPAPDKLTLDGSMDGHDIHMRLTLVDRNRFLLVNRGFHWIQEYPFNR